MEFLIKKDAVEFDFSLLGINVKIISEDRENIKLDFSDLTKAAVRQRFKIDYDGEELEIKERKTHVLSKNVNGTLNLHIPEDLKTYGKMKSKGGDILINSLKFDGKIKFYGGDFKVSNFIEGNTEYKISGGDISINKLIGKTEIKVYGGNVEILDGKILAFEAKAYGGNISVKSVFNLNEDGKIKLYGGNVKLNFIEFKGTRKIFTKVMGGNIILNGDYPAESIVKKEVNNFGSGGNFGTNIPNKLFELFSKIGSSKNKDDKVKKEVEVGKSKENYKEEVDKIITMLEEGKIEAEQATKLIKAIKE